MIKRRIETTKTHLELNHGKKIMPTNSKFGIKYCTNADADLRIHKQLRNTNKQTGKRLKTQRATKAMCVCVCRQGNK